MREKLLSVMPDRATLVAGQGAAISVEVASPFLEEVRALTSLRDAGNLHGVVAKYPVRESGVLLGLAKGLRFVGRSDYERAALTRIGADASLQALLRAVIGAISPVLS
jgi:hypothetical protein